ncbi:MAG: metallophosphoesterase family protein [Candidatus Loosdrechtia sp.]|uniref:metallophosphoesterase family protein n=1 Tax=Candidatus Loosdrechtia sp. TaxID=3101272 RepID=UPI003A68CDAD|nr:MAG: metallophosphoesterase family protein [Candidatus Jettenia sp. AMX2]
MKYIVLSDIHGNVDAFLSVMKEIADKEEGVDCIIIAGDIVGYGASPNECCDLIRFFIYGKREVPLSDIYKIVSQSYIEKSQRDHWLNAMKLFERKGLAIGGNHDKEAVDEPSLTSEMNPVARVAINWTKGVLTKRNVKFLWHLPFRKKFGREGFEIVHATPAYPEGYEYARNAGVLKYKTLWSKITFGGHTHRPAAYIYTKETRTVNASVLIPADSYDMRLMLVERQSSNRMDAFTVNVEKEWKYYINVGSVGQPRDGNPSGCYVVFDSASKYLALKRAPYNTEAAAEKIKDAKLPNELAQRIIKGV